MTATIPADTFQAQYPLALAALGNHMLAHQLPAPYEIHQDGHEITIRLSGGIGIVEAWVASVAVDEEDSEYHEFGGIASVRSAFLIRLPDSGFRFTLIGYRPAPLWKPTVVAS